MEKQLTGYTFIAQINFNIVVPFGKIFILLFYLNIISNNVFTPDYLIDIQNIWLKQLLENIENFRLGGLDFWMVENYK